MPVTVRPIIVTADLDRLLAFCTGLLGRVAHITDPDGNVVNLTQTSE